MRPRPLMKCEESMRTVVWQSKTDLITVPFRLLALASWGYVLVADGGTGNTPGARIKGGYIGRSVRAVNDAACCGAASGE